MLFNGKKAVKAKQWLDKRYRDSAPGKSTIIDWYADFKRGCTNTDDAERCGRPKSAVVPENITKVHKIKIMRVITRRATTLAADRSRGAISPASILRESRTALAPY